MKARLFIAVTLLCTAVAAISATPAYTGFVNDHANKLLPDERVALEKKLRDYEARTSNEVAVLTVPSLDGEEIAEYATRVGIEWGVGKKEKDNGVLIVYAEAERKCSIAVGRGLEAVLPDAITSRIVREELKPHVRLRTYRALFGAVERIEQAAAGEFSSEGSPSPDGSASAASLFLIIVGIVALGILGAINPVVSAFAGGAMGWFAGGFAGMIIGAIVGLVIGIIVKVVASGGGHSGYSGGSGDYSGGSSSSSSSSSFSFGGGDFGGGGASGDAD